MRRTALFALGGAVAGAMMHILVVFLMPAVAARDPWAGLPADLADGKFHLLPIGGSEAPLVFADPEMIYAACIFSLGQGPIRVRADSLPEDVWFATIRDRNGRPLYTIGDRAIPGPLDLFIVNTADVDVVRADPPEFLETAVVVDLPLTEGVLLLSAFVPDSTAAEAIRTALARADCAAPFEPETTPAPKTPAAPVQAEPAAPPLSVSSGVGAARPSSVGHQASSRSGGGAWILRRSIDGWLLVARYRGARFELAFDPYPGKDHDFAKFRF